MTGEVKRYAFYDRHTGCQVDPTEILPGDTTNDDTFIANADHLAVVEGLRATLAERDEECLLLSAQNRELDEALAVVEDNARRYEWLRNHGLVASDPQTADELDAAIDEAMRGGDDLAR